jgi:hypothetical protein
VENDPEPLQVQLSGQAMLKFDSFLSSIHSELGFAWMPVAHHNLFSVHDSELILCYRLNVTRMYLHIGRANPSPFSQSNGKPSQLNQ